MVLRILLIGSPHERAAFRQSVREAFEGRAGFRLDFDEHLRLPHAIESFDSGEQPKFVIATPSVILDQAIDLFRHVRGRGRSLPLILWRYRPIGDGSADALTQLSTTLVTSDDPIYVTKVVVERVFVEQVGAVPGHDLAARI